MNTETFMYFKPLCREEEMNQTEMCECAGLTV
jgi:hypothetical protein